MKSLLISDLHSNREALSRILEFVAKKGVSRMICLGDIVGYGAEPDHVIEQLRRSRRKKMIIRGNHDRVAIGETEGDDFNEVAREAIYWTRERLSRSSLRFLEDLPKGPIEEASDFLICHGSPDDEDEYVLSEFQAARILNDWPQRLIFFGHTHLPCLYRLGEERVQLMWIEEPMTIHLEPDRRYMINPGSVGQPRDYDWRTSFAIWDDERDTVQFFRLEYDVASTQHSIRGAGLPSILADRLGSGF
ncbi:MAG: metallophosphoesterase family protein [Thermoanaerobaculia bacterium]|nr:metallophosphoesterase family protein [Thermoanaerobaculia bacterium]